METKESQSTKTIKRGAILIALGISLMLLNSPKALESILAMNPVRLLYLFVFLPILVLKRNFLTHRYHVRVTDEKGCPAVGQIVEKRAKNHDYFSEHWVERRKTDAMGLCTFDSIWKVGLRKHRKPKRNFTVTLVNASTSEVAPSTEIQESDLKSGETVQVHLVYQPSSQ